MAGRSFSRATGSGRRKSVVRHGYGRLQSLRLLFIDLEPTRFKQFVTWRKLTVGENLEVVPRDIAVGYRVQNGLQQWMFYRVLAGRGNRTVLGYNTSYEFGCQRFLPNGTLDAVSKSSERQRGCAIAAS